MDKIKAEYEKLTQKMKQSLPIKALPSAELVSKLKGSHKKLTIKSEFLINDVMNTGDISGILCIIDCKDATDRIACALAHIVVDPSNPLLPEIEKYQRKRAKRLDIQSKQR